MVALGSTVLHFDHHLEVVLACLWTWMLFGHVLDVIPSFQPWGNVTYINEKLFQTTNISCPWDSLYLNTDWKHSYKSSSLLRLDFPLQICTNSFQIECICACAQALFFIMDSVIAKEVTHEPVILRCLPDPFLYMGIMLAALQASGRAAVCKGR